MNSGLNEISIGRMVALMGTPSFILTFVLTIIFGLILLPVMRKLAVGQKVRDDGPATHLKKTGTPTFGGLMFLFPLLITGVLFPMIPIMDFLRVDKAVAPLFALAVFTFCIGIVGFIDDFVKVKVNMKGLSALVKSILLLVVISGFTIYYLYFSGIKPFILLPFTDLSTGGVPLEVGGIGKIIYGLVVVFILYVTSNSVNLTDGVDGLAASVTAIVATTLGIIGAVLNSPFSLSASFFSFAVAAGCVAFFIFNRHPAKIMMGDTGSQALGAAVAAIAIFAGVPWILIPAGIIYVMESLSVVIQVSHYKKHKKRIFRMAPLHHHYELGGWSEWKVVGVFCLITLIGCAVALWMVF
ncbi:MAG: phospho-N-acetylmuramoyl-pentapeptide-transferase [Saccharofermentanales bacterium]